MYIDEEDEMSVEDNEIPEEETNLTNDKQATESDDSRVQYSMDEESCRSINSAFIIILFSIHYNYMNLTINELIVIRSQSIMCEEQGATVDYNLLLQSYNAVFQF